MVRHGRTRAKLIKQALRRELHPLDALRQIGPLVGSNSPSLLRPDPRGPALVLSPHLDDAALSCWSVLAGKEDVKVINLFAGVPSPNRLSTWDRMTGATDSASRMRERLAEDREALAMAGRKSLNLTFAELEHRRNPPTLAELRSAVVETVPRASAVYGPAGLGGHPDHRLAKTVALLLGGGGVPVYLYADLPYAVNYGWPDWVTGESAPHLLPAVDWEPHLAHPWISSSDLRPHIRTFSSEQSALKLQALKAYRSQYPALTGGSKDFLSRPEILRFELHWEVRHS